MKVVTVTGEKSDMVRERSTALRAIREFFWDRAYLEVETPCLGRTAPPDPDIEPLRVYVGPSGPHYLHTSPEMGMKKLVGRGYEKIFQVCKAFRIEEFEEHHAIEFTMLEWYMKGGYVEAMEETARLVRSVGRAMESRLATPRGRSMTWRGSLSRQPVSTPFRSTGIPSFRP